MPRRSRLAPDASVLAPLGTQTDEQVLATLIRSVTRQADALETARRLLSFASRLDALPTVVSSTEATSRSSVDQRLAQALAAGIELGIRCCERAVPVPSRVRSSADVARLLGPRLRLLDHEQLWILALDAGSRPVGMGRVAEGGRHGCAVLARDVLRAALSFGACSFVLAHNHPGGDPTPSRQDTQLTASIARAAALIDVPLLDHVIVARDAHTSLLDLGLLPESASARQPGAPAHHDSSIAVHLAG